MTRMMMLAIAFLVACGGPKKHESSMVPEGQPAPETCCCKTTPATSEDGKPVYAMANRMECSTQQGECEAEVQCNAKPAE